jgi:CRP/FNR family nitrogen fixation transcriptional regulator
LDQRRQLPRPRALSCLHEKGILGFVGQTQRQIVLLDRSELAKLDL